MDGFTSKKTLSSLPTSPPHAVQETSFPGVLLETDENEQNTKIPIAKHFREPNVSAGSKTVAPRNKILGESNESLEFSDSDLQKPYDPLTNYLSPRPRYLCYNPYRHRGIFLQLENDDIEAKRSTYIDSQKFSGDEGSQGDAQDSSDPPSEGKSESENNEISREVESDDEEEDDYAISEDKGFKFKWVFIYLIMMVLVFSLMNFPMLSPTEQAVDSFRDTCRVYEVVSIWMNEERSEYHGQIEESPGTFLGLDQRDVYQEPDKVELIKDNDNKVAVSENELGEGVHHELDCKEVTETISLEDDDKGNNKDAFYRPMKSETDSAIEVEKEDPELLQKHEALDKIDVIRKYQALESDSGADTPNASKSEFDQMKAEYEVTPADIKDEVIIPENMTNNDILPESDTSGSEVEMKSNYAKSQEIGFILATFIAGLAFAIFIYYVTQLKQATKPVQDSRPVIALMKNSSRDPKGLAHVTQKVEAGHVESKTESFAKVPSLSGSMEEYSKHYILEKSYRVEMQASLLPRDEVERFDMKTESFAESLSLTKELSHAKAPEVELLGELCVGDHEVSSSLRSVRRGKPIETEETSNRSLPTPMHPSSSKHLASGSPSYRSFTAEKNISKKEGIKDGGAKNVIKTPMRRSSRIRNRAVMSP